MRKTPVVSNATYLSPTEIATEMIKKLRPAARLSWTEIPESDLIMGHHSVGRDIRNYYKLWHADNPYTDASDPNGDKHPDQVSMAIMHDVWQRLQREDAAKTYMKNTVPGRLNLNRVFQNNPRAG